MVQESRRDGSARPPYGFRSHKDFGPLYALQAARKTATNSAMSCPIIGVTAELFLSVGPQRVEALVLVLGVNS